MKPLFIVSCPIDTYSGYGARSRDFVKALIETDKYDVKILPQRWGETPWGFIRDHKKWQFLTPHLLPMGNKLPRQPELWCQITIPNEFQNVGKFNIGLTAGIETTGVHHTWIQGCNKMDLVLTSSTHSANVLKAIEFQQVDKATNAPTGTLKIKKPVEVLIEGADTSLYQPKVSNFNLDLVKEDFAYLFMGHWMQGNIGHDRKNVGYMIQIFLETFKNKKQTPALILKTSGGGASAIDRQTILEKIDIIRNSIPNAKTLPNIYLIHGDYTDEEISHLYTHKKVKALISLTKGEGFGRPMLEFSLTKKPVITTNWSGHTDFLSSEYSVLLPGELHKVDKSAMSTNIIMEEFQWFGVDAEAASVAMKDVYVNYKNYKEKAVKQANKSKTEFSYAKMVEQLNSYLSKYVPNFPKQVELDLSKVKKIDTPKLPKLKKVTQ
jgi:hypothetical protein